MHVRGMCLVEGWKGRCGKMAFVGRTVVTSSCNASEDGLTWRSAGKDGVGASRSTASTRGVKLVVRGCDAAKPGMSSAGRGDALRLPLHALTGTRPYSVACMRSCHVPPQQLPSPFLLQKFRKNNLWGCSYRTRRVWGTMLDELGLVSRHASAKTRKKINSLRARNEGLIGQAGANDTRYTIYGQLGSWVSRVGALHIISSSSRPLHNRLLPSPIVQGQCRPASCQQ